MTGIDENGSVEDEDHHLVENGETRGKIVYKHMGDRQSMESRKGSRVIHTSDHANDIVEGVVVRAWM